MDSCREDGPRDNKTIHERLTIGNGSASSLEPLARYFSAFNVWAHGDIVESESFKGVAVCIFLNHACALQEAQLVLPMFEDRRPLPDHVYSIIDCGNTIAELEFCSSLCVESFVDQMLSDRELRCEWGTWTPKQNRALHYVETRKRRTIFCFPAEALEAGAA